jgi:hypothetical protein
VQLALTGTDNGAVYQLYRDDTPLSGVTVTGTDSPATFSGLFTEEGTYTAKTVAGVFCPLEMSGSPTVAVLISPDPPELSHDGPKCAGEYITFTASGSTEYTWTLPESGSGNTMNSPASTAGDYQASVQAAQTYIGNTCYSLPATASSTIYETPAQPSLTHSGDACVGNAITFTASESSGSYDWDGDFDGTGSTKLSTTSEGLKSASVRAFTSPTLGTVCYSPFIAVSAYILVPSEDGATANICGCATGMTECVDKVCRTVCPRCVMIRVDNCGSNKSLCANTHECLGCHFLRTITGNKYWFNTCTNNDCSTYEASKYHAWATEYTTCVPN